jgi:hypothetical protein
MKNLLVALLALSAVSAFADNHAEHMHEGKNLKHMVRFMGFTDAGASRSFDVSLNSNDADSETNTTNIALNYAYAINNNWQVGATYKSFTGEVAGSDVDATTMGLSGYYNWGKSLDSTCYVALHYNVTNIGENGDYNDVTLSEDDTVTDISVEYGHRFHVGHVWGLHLTYAPSVAYTVSTFEPDAAGADEVDTNTLAWNFVKFDVLF